VKAVPKYWRIYIAALLGALLGGLTLLADKPAFISANPVIGAIQNAAMFLTIPGLIGSVAVSSNVHAFSLIAAAIINTVIYFCLVLLSFGMLKKVRRK
jgi:hypothetical protein